MSQQEVIVCRLGRVDYKRAWDLQAGLQQQLIAAKRMDPPVQLPHVILTVEHPPVFTLGKSGDERNLLLDKEALTARGAQFFRIDRGGDITFHGPGQLVVYPILDLDRFFTDIHRYLRELEEAVISTCRDYGIQARRVDRRTGVWVGPDARGAERKVCAMGIRCSRWVTMHGLALNVNTDLDFFSMIVPCGIVDRGVTSLAEETRENLDLEQAGDRLLGNIGERFNIRPTMLSGSTARRYLEERLERPDVFTQV